MKLKRKGLFLLIAFCVYACIIFVFDPGWKTSHIEISIPFIAGMIALLITFASLIISSKFFEIILPIFFFGCVLYFEYQPFTVSIAKYQINSIPFFYGKPIPFLFLLSYVILYFKEIRLFVLGIGKSV